MILCQSSIFHQLQYFYPLFFPIKIVLFLLFIIFQTLTHITFQMEQKTNSKVFQYLKSPQLSFLQDLIVQVAKQEPTDPVDFCIGWLQNHHEKKRPLIDLQSSEEEMEIDEEEQQKIRERIQIRKGRKVSRQGVSSEVFGEYNRRESYAPKVVEKEEESRNLLSSLLKKSIFFQNISSSDEKLLIDAVEESIISENEAVITEGETGNLLYIVESGLYDCYKIINGVETYLKTYECGDIFGQLALLYNAPRAASIKCREGGKLFTLDRVTFNMVMTGAANKKREHIVDTLGKIEMFSNFSQYEKQQICDAVKQEKYKGGDSVIHQGQKGDKFYIIHSGMLVAEKYDENTKKTQTVYRYRSGDYFGELALLNDVCRQATVKTVTDCVLFTIDRQSFLRLLGSVTDIMERNKEKYAKYQASLAPVCC